MNWKNAYVGQLPNRLVIDIVDNDTYTGSIAKNPFKHFNAFRLGTYLNGKMPGLPLKLNFTDNQYTDGYRNFFATAGRIDMDNSLNIIIWLLHFWIRHISQSLSWRASRMEIKWNFTNKYRV